MHTMKQELADQVLPMDQAFVMDQTFGNEEADKIQAFFGMTLESCDEKRMASSCEMMTGEIPLFALLRSSCVSLDEG